MKKLLFTSLILCFIFSGCKTFDKFTQFQMPYKSTVVIPATTVINLPLDILTPEIESNSQSTFEINDTRKDLIEEIKLTSLNIKLKSPSGGNFSFLKSANIYISATGLAEARIAFKENIPDTVGAFIQLELSTLDLQEYIKQDKFTLRVNTITDELFTSDQEVEVNAVLFVDAKIVGQ